MIDSNGNNVFESRTNSGHALDAAQFSTGTHHATDLNGDGKVDIQDITITAVAYNSRQGDLKWNPAADFNNDQRIAIVDIALVARDYGKTF
jgi:hypothetical protein